MGITGELVWTWACDLPNIRSGSGNLCLSRLAADCFQQPFRISNQSNNLKRQVAYIQAGMYG